MRESGVVALDMTDSPLTSEALATWADEDRPHDPVLRPALAFSAFVAALLIYGWASAWL